MTDLLTSGEVNHLKFTVRHVRGGYDMSEVDEALDTIAQTLSAHETKLLSKALRAYGVSLLAD